MASWAVHFRVADYLLDKINTLDKNYFIIGNIAPDCGVPAEDGYDPPSEITHRTGGGNYKGRCNYNSIFSDFIENETDICKKSFWVGYFVHLVTDCLWVKLIHDELDKLYGPLRISSPVSKEIRREWYNLDFEYFYENVSQSFEIFKSLNDFDEDYPDFYSKDCITDRIKYIKDFYKNKPDMIDYKYTNMADVGNFISIATGHILLKLKEYNISL